MSAHSKRIAVVGGGPAGVVTCRFLAEAGHQPVVFEAGNEVGGIWAPEPTNKVVYDGLVTNLPTIVMQSFDLDFRKGLPSYIKADEYGRYVLDYVEHFALRKYVRLNAAVTWVEALAEEEEEEACGRGAWRVRGRRQGDDGGDEVFEESFQGVVVASGHYSLPYEPAVPGQGAWLSAGHAPGARTVTHAWAYKNPEKFASRTVLLVGGRSSAVDIARELRQTARFVYVLDKGCGVVLMDENCMHVPLGARLTERGHLVLDSAELAGPEVDDVILATGYQYDFPFLDTKQLGLDFGPHGRYVKPLHQHLVHARRPSLCFMGIPLAVPCPIPLFEAQARYVAGEYSNMSTTLEERLTWVQARSDTVGARQQDMHFLSEGAWSYMRELVGLSGLQGDALDAYCHRLAAVESVYRDRVAKRPRLPWGDDWYRRCEYQADWDSGEFRVAVPAE